MKRAVIFDYNSRFTEHIKWTIKTYNRLHPQDAFRLDSYNYRKCRFESQAGSADFIIHSGGDGMPVKENTGNVPKLYICHSHQWKARQEGGVVVRLKDYIKGIRYIDVLESDAALGHKAKLPIMEYHTLAVVHPPACAKVLAISKAKDKDGKDIEIIEALKYPDGSVSIQGHPEEGTAAGVFYNLFERLR